LLLVNFILNADLQIMRYLLIWGRAAISKSAEESKFSSVESRSSFSDDAVMYMAFVSCITGSPLRPRGDSLKVANSTSGMLCLPMGAIGLGGDFSNFLEQTGKRKIFSVRFCFVNIFCSITTVEDGDQ
jgi:hypothetical protein